MPDTFSILLKTTSVYFAAAAVLHAHMSIRNLFPFFGPNANSFHAFVFKNICLQLSGYFVVNSKSIGALVQAGFMGPR